MRLPVVAAVASVPQSPPDSRSDSGDLIIHVRVAAPAYQTPVWRSPGSTGGAALALDIYARVIQRERDTGDRVDALLRDADGAMIRAQIRSTRQTRLPP